jgi:tight adherence protein B
MDTITLLFSIAIFFFVAAVIQVVYLFWSDSRFVGKRRIKKRLLYISAGGKHGQDKLEIYKKGALKEVGALERFFFKMPRVSDLDKLLFKVNFPLNASLFIILSLAFGVAGFALGYRYLPNTSSAFALSLVLLFAPYFFLKLAEKSYYEKFNDQLPEALDLLARAVRSGNALTAGLGMIAEQIDDPIRSEFGATVDEINLGLTLNEAMENLCERVPISDLRFFAIAILVQKETGGNVGEILDNISRLIRERIQFKRQVQALTAEGRYSAIILIGLPVLMFVYMYFTNYDYLSLLWLEKTGQYMLFGGVIMQIVGSYVIKRIVSIDI